MKKIYSLSLVVIATLFSQSCVLSNDSTNTEEEKSTRTFTQPLTHNKVTVQQVRGIHDFAAKGRGLFPKQVTDRDYSAGRITRSVGLLAVDGYAARYTKTQVDAGNNIVCAVDDKIAAVGTASLSNGSQITTAFHNVFPFRTVDDLNLAMNFGPMAKNDLPKSLEDPSHINDMYIANPELFGSEENSYFLTDRLFSLGLEDWVGPDKAPFRYKLLSSNWMYEIDDWVNQKQHVILDETLVSPPHSWRILEISDVVGLSLTCPKNVNGGVSERCQLLNALKIPRASRDGENNRSYSKYGVPFLESSDGSTFLVPVPKTSSGPFSMDTPALFFDYTPVAGVLENDVVDIEKVHNVSDVSYFIQGQLRYYALQYQDWYDSGRNIYDKTNLIDFDANVNFDGLAGGNHSFGQYTCFDNNANVYDNRLTSKKTFGAAADVFEGSSGGPMLSPRFYEADDGLVFGGNVLNSIGVLSLVFPPTSSGLSAWDETNPVTNGSSGNEGTDPEIEPPPISPRGVDVALKLKNGSLFAPITLGILPWLNEREHGETIKPPNINDEEIDCVEESTVGGVCEKYTYMVCENNTPCISSDGDGAPIIDLTDKGAEASANTDTTTWYNKVINCSNTPWSKQFDHSPPNHSETDRLSLAVGFVGSVRLDQGSIEENKFQINEASTIGTLGLVCAPYYQGSWTDNYNYLFVVASHVNESLQTLKNNVLWGYFKDVMLRAYEVRDQVVNSPREGEILKENSFREVLKPVSTKMCPPNYYLDGVEYYRTEDEHYIRGISKLICTHSEKNKTGNENSSGVWENSSSNTLEVELDYKKVVGVIDTTYFGDTFDVSSWIGNPKEPIYEHRPRRASCNEYLKTATPRPSGTDRAMLKGISVFYDNSSRVTAISLRCISAPGHN